MNCPQQKLQRWLAWCLVALLPCLCLGIAQRQTLGPLHVHAVSVSPAPVSGLAGTTLLHQALIWWWAQVRTQTQSRQHARAHAHSHAHAHAHGQEHAHPEAPELPELPELPEAPEAPAQAHAHAEPAAHAHAVWQRHRHSPRDASVVALDATGDNAGAQSAAASLLLPLLGAPARGLQIDAGAALHRAWPWAGAARFGSWGSAPPLQPPRV